MIGSVSGGEGCVCDWAAGDGCVTVCVWVIELEGEGCGFSVLVGGGGSTLGVGSAGYGPYHQLMLVTSVCRCSARVPTDANAVLCSVQRAATATGGLAHSFRL